MIINIKINDEVIAIREYDTDIGDKVMVFKYDWNGKVEYRVVMLLNADIEPYWTQDLQEAVKHAQLLSAKY